MNLDIPYFSLLLLVAFLLEYNVDEKNMQNIEAKTSIEISLYQSPLDDDTRYLLLRHTLCRSRSSCCYGYKTKTTAGGLTITSYKLVIGYLRLQIRHQPYVIRKRLQSGLRLSQTRQSTRYSNFKQPLKSKFAYCSKY